MKTFLRRNGAWIGFIALTITFALLAHFAQDKDLLSARNLTNLLRQTTTNGILAAGMTLVILTGGIDLSIGSIVALCGVLTGISQVWWGWENQGVGGILRTIFLSIGVGGICGWINGGLVALLGIPPFVITLGMMVIARGIALILTDGSGISPLTSLQVIAEGYLSAEISIAVIALIMLAFLWNLRKNFLDLILPFLVLGSLGGALIAYKGFPVPVLYLLAVLGISAFVLKFTALGRCVYAIGSNEQAAFWAGVPVKKVKWIVYTILGLLSGLAGVLLSTRLNGATPTAGNLFELDAIAAVVIGGASLRGGVGTIMGTLAGSMTIGILNLGMDVLEVSSFYQMVLKGVIIILAVSVDKNQRIGS